MSAPYYEDDGDPRRPCHGRNVNVCVGEGCYGKACLTLADKAVAEADPDSWEWLGMDR